MNHCEKLTARNSTEKEKTMEEKLGQVTQDGAMSSDSESEKRRSAVRGRVTYAVISAYLVLASVVILRLMWADEYEVAIGVLGGVAGLAGSIAGFWFGSRRPPST